MSRQISPVRLDGHDARIQESVAFFRRHRHDAEHDLLRRAVDFRDHFDILTLTVPFDLNGDDGMAVRSHGFRNITPLGNVFIADANDAVPFGKAGVFSRRSGNGRTDDGFRRYGHRPDGKEQAPKEDDSQHKVHDPAGSDDDQPGRNGLIQKGFFIERLFFRHAGNAVKPAEGNHPQGVFRIAAARTV